ncbi:MAG: LPXTG cell wall anchor domain-containing protein [Lachnospiraceae bacterium]|nr:LPXTG cell wall anchor domain-containing protein [Lachnospiraceae bacterium]
MKKNRIIKNTILGLVVASVLSTAVPAMAMSYTGDPDWSVSFSQDEKMVSNFTTGQIYDVMDQMQPGDNAKIELTVRNDNDASTDWYMKNDVIESLEESVSVASGGAYSYRLTYNGEDLYNSDDVGGDGTSKAGIGLHQATNSLKDYFYLDTLKKGETGKVTLEVALEGETQGNDYQDTLAKVDMSFAVELTPTGGNTTKHNTINRSKVVKTGDTNMAPYAIAGGIAGAILLVLAVASARRRRKEARA